MYIRTYTHAYTHENYIYIYLSDFYNNNIPRKLYSTDYLILLH